MAVKFCALLFFICCVVVEGTWGPPRPRGKLSSSPPHSSKTLCPSNPYPTANASSVQRAMKSYLEGVGNEMSSALRFTPGGAVVSVVYRDAVIWTHEDGVIDMSDPDRGPPTANTGFRIGSITKVFTALMTLMLRDTGKLSSLDENITTYLPEFSIRNFFKTRRGITFRQLSSHMSGLPRNPPCPGIFDTGCNLSYSQIYDNLSIMRLMFPPGTQPQYSNLGFGLLGRVLEKVGGGERGGVGGVTWEDMLVDMVLKPLGMNNSGNSFNSETIKDIAVGYYPDGTPAKLIDIGWDAPAGQMYSSTNDLSQLLKLIFRPEDPYNSNTNQILDGETIREWMQPAYVYPDGTGFGHPWELEPLDNYTLRTKAGVMNGYNAEIQFAHEIKTGFVFLHSCDGCSSHQKVIDLAQGIIQQVSSVLEGLQSGPQLPPSPTDYVGNYTTGESTATVGFGTMYGHKALILTNSENHILLEWRGEDTFQQSLHGAPQPCYKLGQGDVGEWVYFTRRARDGAIVESFTIPGLAYGVEYRRVP